MTQQSGRPASQPDMSPIRWSRSMDNATALRHARQALDAPPAGRDDRQQRVLSSLLPEDKTPALVYMASHLGQAADMAYQDIIDYSRGKAAGYDLAEHFAATHNPQHPQSLTVRLDSFVQKAVDRATREAKEVVHAYWSGKTADVNPRIAGFENAIEVCRTKELADGSNPRQPMTEPSVTTAPGNGSWRHAHRPANAPDVVR